MTRFQVGVLVILGLVVAIAVWGTQWQYDARRFVRVNRWTGVRETYDCHLTPEAAQEVAVLEAALREAESKPPEYLQGTRIPLPPIINVPAHIRESNPELSGVFVLVGQVKRRIDDIRSTCVWGWR